MESFGRIMKLLLTLCIINCNSTSSISPSQTLAAQPISDSVSLTFGNASLFCVKSMNVSIKNPTDHSIQISANNPNDTQFAVRSPTLTDFEMPAFSHMNLSLTFTPLSIGEFHSLLSIHPTGNGKSGVVNFYLYAVGTDNKYNIKPVTLTVNGTHSVNVTNPFNDTLLISRVEIANQVHGLHYRMSMPHNRIEPNSEQTISAVSYNPQRQISKSPSPSPKYKEIKEISEMEFKSFKSRMIIDTNYDILSVPITYTRTESVSIPTVIKQKRNRNSKYIFPLIDFNVLTRPNMTISKKIKFKNPTAHAIIITSIALINHNKHTKRKYIRIHRNFNKSFLILPNKMVDLGSIILIAIPNKNKNNKPIKTNYKINATLIVSFIEPYSSVFDGLIMSNLSMGVMDNGLACDNTCANDIPDTQIIQMTDDPESDMSTLLLQNEESLIANEMIDNIAHLRLVQSTKYKKYKNKMQNHINGWILLGNLNYSFQQSLFYPKLYWNNTKQTQYVPMIRDMTMQNNFLIPLKLTSICIFDCNNNSMLVNNGQLDFEIVEFYKGKEILDGENGTICKLKYYPQSNKSNYDTQLVLNTNITSFQIPITVYNGQLTVMHANMTNDMGRRIEINTKHNWFNPSAHIVKNMSCNHSHQCLAEGPLQIMLDFGQIPLHGKMVNTLELRNANPVHLSLSTAIREYNTLHKSGDRVFRDSYDALFDESNDINIINLFLHQRHSDMTVQSIETINKYEYAYLAIGIAPEMLTIPDLKGKSKKKYVFYTFLNVTANNSHTKDHENDEIFMMQWNNEWISTAISSYLLRIKIVFEVYFGTFNVRPRPIWFDHSFPGKALRSQTVSMYNYYDLDIILDPKQTHLMHNMFHILFAKSNYRNGLLSIGHKSNKNIAKIYFNPNTKHTKYGNYIYINSTETHLFNHFDLLNVSATLINKYKAFKQLNFGVISSVIDVDEIHSVNFHEKGINLRELFIDQYRIFLWDKIRREKNNKAQTIAHFYSKNIGKIPFIIFGELIMPSFIINDKQFEFGNVMVGSSQMLNISVQNLFNDTVQISLIMPINDKEAIFFPTHNKKYKPTHMVILAPYSTGVLGPIQFRPRRPTYYHQMLYLRNNLSIIESFNVSGEGQQGMLKIENSDEFDDEFDDEEEDEEEYIEEINDIMYPLHMIDKAYIPVTVQKKYRIVIKELLNIKNKQKNAELLRNAKKHTRDENGGYIYHIHTEDTPAKWRIWQVLNRFAYVNTFTDMFAGMFADNDMIGDDISDVFMDSDYDKEDMIEIEFTPNDYGLVHMRNGYDFVDSKHRHMFMEKIKSGHYLQLKRKFRTTNYGNMAITLEGMTFIQSGVEIESESEVNETLFSTHSACIYEFDMFNTFNSNVIDAESKKEKAGLHKNSKSRRRHSRRKNSVSNDLYLLICQVWQLISTIVTYACNVIVIIIDIGSEHTIPVLHTQSNVINESVYGMNYYLEQSGMDFVQYNGADTGDIWSSHKHRGFGVIGCELFPLQLKPKESKDFVLIFNYDLVDAPPIYNHLYIKTSHMEIINNSVKKSNTLYFKSKTKFDIDINLFHSLSALKPLEKGKAFIKIHTFRICLFLTVLIAINIVYKIMQHCFDIQISNKVHEFMCDKVYVPIKQFIYCKLNVLLPIWSLAQNTLILLWKLVVIICDFVYTKVLPKTKRFRKFKRKCASVYNDIKRKIITFFQHIAFEFHIISKHKSNVNESNAHTTEETNKIVANESGANNSNRKSRNNRRKKNNYNSPQIKPQPTTPPKPKMKPKKEIIKSIPKPSIPKKPSNETEESVIENDTNNDSSESDISSIVEISATSSPIIVTSDITQPNTANVTKPIKEKAQKVTKPDTDTPVKDKLKSKDNSHKNKRKSKDTPPNLTKKKPYKSTHKSSPTHASKTRTVLMSKTPQHKHNKNSVSYASRAKGVSTAKTVSVPHTNNRHKPRKPPRPHPRPHHSNGSTSQSPEMRTAIDELLAETKAMPMPKIVIKRRPRNFSDPVMIESQTFNTEVSSSQSTTSTSSEIASNMSNSSVSSLRERKYKNPILPPGINIYQSHKSHRGTKPPFKKGQNMNKVSANKIMKRHPSILNKHSKSVSPKYSKDSVVVSSNNNEAELVIPLNVEYGNNRMRNVRINKKKSIKKLDYNSIFKDNDFQIEHITKWTNYDTNIGKDSKKYKPKNKQKSKKQKSANLMHKSTLNTKAMPFVPSLMKHKYNSKGELRKKHSKKNNSKNTFSSLYTTNQINDDSFLLSMAKAMNHSPSPSPSPSEDEDELALMYHVPDGILSSPTNRPTDPIHNPTVNKHYNRILKPYPMNYSSTPSPKQSSLMSPNGFGIDLQTLGYNISPPRHEKMGKLTKNGIGLPKELEPQNSVEIGIQKSLNSIISDGNNDGLHMGTNDLFDMREERGNEDSTDNQSSMAGIRLSALY